MNHAEMVVLIVLIVMIASVFRAKYRGSGKGEHRDSPAVRDADSDRLRDEMKQLKERIAVLERLATDDTSSLDREIEKLRDRDRV
jgi:Tfp pilus assembly protein PilO